MSKVIEGYRILIIIVTALAIGSLLFWVLKMGDSLNNHHIIELTNDGFHPKKLIINRGDTVKFSSNNDEPYWPASNSHPIHNIYPEFDPKRPLEPSETWEFTFTKVGSWDFHDHLYSVAQGTVDVQ